jgi:alpha-glucosidase
LPVANRDDILEYVFTPRYGADFEEELTIPVPEAIRPRADLGQVLSARPDARGVTIEAEGGVLRIDALADDLIRIRASCSGEFDPVPSFAVAKTDWPVTRVSIAKDAATVTVEIASARVHVRRSDAVFTVETSAGRPLLADAAISFAESGGFRLSWKQPADRRVYGCGEKAGPLERRGAPMEFYNTDHCEYVVGGDPLYQSIPFCIGMDGGAPHGLFMDNTFRQKWTLGEIGATPAEISVDGGQMDLYLFTAAAPKAVLARYTELTGRHPLPPLWAMGYQQCRFSYDSDSMVREIAQGFRSRNVPCDVLYFDIHYMDRYRDFTWDHNRFPNPKGLISDLRENGFRTIAILDPGIPNDPGYAPYDTLMETGLVVRNPDGTPFVGPVWPGNCVFPDFTDAKCREWWGGWYKGLVDDGIAGFWNDMNEPAVFERDGLHMPEDCVHPGADGFPDVHARYHNVYGMQMARGTYEGLLKLRPEQRPFVLSRAAFAGIQRYAATWTGDNVASWTHLRMSVSMLLNMGLSGEGLSGPDIGGFVFDTTPELFGRWLQVGALFPFSRAHSATPGLAGAGEPFQPQEPWVFGDDWTEINRASIELRYRLMPTIYTLTEELTRTGIPLMRPLLLEYPNDPSCADLDNEFLVGANLLVAPILDEGATSRTVYLPAGEWYDFWTDERLEGGRNLTVDAPLSKLPLFVRAGAVIVAQPVVQHTGEMSGVPLEFRVYLKDGQAAGEVYEDDGASFGYQAGEYRRTTITAKGQGGRVAISTWAEGSYASPRPEPTVTVIGG